MRVPDVERSQGGRQRRRSMHRLGAVVVLVLVLTGCSGGGHGTTAQLAGHRVAPTDPTGAAAPRLPAHAVKVVAVGDIACAPGDTITTVTCQQAATARLTQSLDPSWVLALGDEQYESGHLADFEASYDASWGGLNSRTKALPGNHEYDTSGAADYFTYFGRRAPGYYATTLGSWRVYMLNSNCDRIDCALEQTWLRNDLAAHPTGCSLIAMHHPRYSSGAEHGSQAAMAPFWQIAIDHHVDLALAGHEHDYERFARMDASGHPSATGLISFVVGTGGKSLYPLRARLPGSAYYENTQFGVLELWLGDSGFAWEFRTVAASPTGVVRDSGSGSCL